MTPVNCRHAGEASKGAVRCALDLYGGRPSTGVCAGCRRREPIDGSKGPLFASAVPAPSVPAPVEMPVELLTETERIGLGDLVEAGAKAVGLDKLVKVYEKLTGKRCGCSQRKEYLNRIMLWRRQRNKT